MASKSFKEGFFPVDLSKTERGLGLATTELLSRRQFLKLAGAFALLGLAGCAEPQPESLPLEIKLFDEYSELGKALSDFFNYLYSKSLTILSRRIEEPNVELTEDKKSQLINFLKSFSLLQTNFLFQTSGNNPQYKEEKPIKIKAGRNQSHYRLSDSKKCRKNCTLA